MLFQEVESGNESAPEQLSRENSASEFSHTYEVQPGQIKKISTSKVSDNQYQVYFYDPKESSSRNMSTSTEGTASANLHRVFPQTPCKGGDVSGYIMIGKYKVRTK